MSSNISELADFFATKYLLIYWSCDLDLADEVDEKYLRNNFSIYSIPPFLFR